MRVGLLVFVAAQAAAVPAFVVPDFADFRITTRQALGEPGSTVTTEILYLKGPRERREHIIERLPVPEIHYVTISQCDRRRTVTLNADAKLFGISPFEEWSRHVERLQPAPEAQRTGADVTITTDTVDTGARRRLGSQVARHVRTRITVEPTAGANTRPREEEIDGWYLDVPGLGCSSAGHSATYLLGEVIRPGGVRDRVRYKTIGHAHRGYPIEETARHAEAGLTTVTTRTLIDFSDAPIDSALFEIPRDYQPALPLVRGGHDLTKPDTIANRLHSYWDEVTSWAASFLR
jgi:hypothetical protein